MNATDTTEQALADLSSDQYDHILLDFDQTLFLDNSTERFLDALRPRLLAFLLIAVSDWLVRALAWVGLCSYNHQRDFMRVLICTVLMPWNLLRWHAVAARLVRDRMNQPLIDALPREKPLVILSFGFYPVIRPLLQAAGLSRATLICSRTLTRLENLRVTGKPAALQKYVPGWDLQRTLFITDSTDDDAVAEIVGKAHIVPWCPVADPAFKGYYLPLRYTVEGKYADRRYFTYQILQEDFALLLLAYSFSAYYVLSLGFLLLSLYTIYEIGYYKNDHEAAAKETNPVVSDAARNFPAHPRFKPWLGALIFGGIGISFATPLYAQPLYGSVLLAGWMLLLVGVYSLFWVFNHLAPINRIFIFPLLHTLKTFSFLFFVPLTLIGALLLAAQVLSISANYLLYRWGGNLQCFNRQAARLFLFGVFAMVLYANIFPVAFSADPIRPTLILVWGMIRTIENAYHKNILRIIAEFVKRSLCHLKPS